MKRAVLLMAAVVAAFGGGAAHASALTAQALSCGHMRLAYSFTSPATDVPYGVSVLSSECGLTTAVTGSGTITFLGPGDSTTCDASLEIVCSRISLSLSTGASPTFTTEGALYFPLVASPVANSTLDLATAEAITGFSTGSGSGVLNTLCTFNNPTESCTADGSFVWAP
ncbi:MAG TPA: hypothetical protein VF137_09280 [Candidatus Dormibacteraeota bacterium]